MVVSLKGKEKMDQAGDVGEQHSIWVSTVEHTLRMIREELDGKAHIEFRILKLLEYQRQPNAEFSPVEWRFGLHNRDENQTDMSESEAAKRAVVVLFGLDEQSKWVSFCDAVVPDPKAMLKCYGLHKEVNDLLEDEIKRVLAFDALFLAIRIELHKSMDWDSRKLVTRELWNWDPMWGCFYHTFHRCYNVLVFDLYKIENQIPFDLIKRTIKHVQNLANPRQAVKGDHAISIGAEAEQVPDSYLERWIKAAVECGMKEFMDISDGFYEGANANKMLSGSHHILDAAYEVVCGVDGMERTPYYSQEGYIHVLLATKLKESGIRIKGVTGPLCGMSYNKKKKCLSLPKMKLYDTTVSLVRNMARYEEYLKDKKCMFHDYLFFMLDLIQTPLDLNHLTKYGVVDNGCGNKGVEMWQALIEGLELLPSSKEHNEMKRHINNRCKLRGQRFWSEFKTLFLSRPWLTMSAIVVILVTVATLIQTYTAVISSNQMKPQFKP